MSQPDRPTPLTDNLPMLRTDDLDAALKWRESHRTLERDRAELMECLDDLSNAVTAEVNEKGGGGYILARLSDAHALLSRLRGEG